VSTVISSEFGILQTVSVRASRISIKARAVRRTGELAKMIEPAKGGNRGNAATGGRPPIGSRKSAANCAGLSSHQLKQGDPRRLDSY